MIRVALFGAGKMALHHIRAIRSIGNAKVVAIADPEFDQRALDDILLKDVSVHSDPEELLKNVKPDIVHVCTPPDTHARLALLALNNGASVYVEKPFALSVPEAEDVINRANDLSLMVCAGHQLLYETPAVKAREHIRKIGKVVHVESYFSFNPVRRSLDGRPVISPNDQLVDILPHPVYLLLHFLKRKPEESEKDEAVRIVGMDFNTAGNVHAVLRRGDVTGNLIVTLEGRPIESYIRIVGTNGCLYADFVRGAFILLSGPGISGISKALNPYSYSLKNVSETTRALLKRVFKKQLNYPGLVEIIKSFYDSCELKHSNIIDNNSIRDTVAVCEEIGKKFRILTGEENRVAEEKLKITESRLPIPDGKCGGVLVTGGTGFLGRVVASLLRNRNWPTRVLSRKVPSAIHRIPGVEYVAADLGDKISSDILKDISIVVHCAAETSGGRALHSRNSIEAIRNLLTAMSEAGVKKLLHISSIAVLKTSHEFGGPMDENAPLVVGEDRGPYVWGKAESERLACNLSKDLGIGIRVIRPGPLVDYKEFEAPGRLGREIGPYFLCMGGQKEPLYVCDVNIAAEIIGKYVEYFDDMPLILNLIEPIPQTRSELLSNVLRKRPDLKVIYIPSIFLRVISPGLKFLQHIFRPGHKPIDLFAAFAPEKYKTDLVAMLIKNMKLSIPVKNHK